MACYYFSQLCDFSKGEKKAKRKTRVAIWIIAGTSQREEHSPAILEEGMAIHSISYLEYCHGQRSLMGYSPWGRKKSDMTE